NSGHVRQMAWVYRTIPGVAEPQPFSTWCPKIIATISTPPGTIASRSFRIRLQRRRRTEGVERLRNKQKQELAVAARRAARWAADNQHAVVAEPADMPLELNDRAADNWSPLLAIADAIGGEWPAAARQAAVLLSSPVDGEDKTEALLADIRTI